MINNKFLQSECREQSVGTDEFKFEDGEVVIIRMEYIPSDLERKLQEGTITSSDGPGNAENIISGIEEGLNHIHQKGFTHGDLTLSNILLDANGTPKICDFGNAYRCGEVTSYNSDLDQLKFIVLDIVFQFKDDERTRTACRKKLLENPTEFPRGITPVLPITEKVRKVFIGGSYEIILGNKSNFFSNVEVDRLVNKGNQQKQSRFYSYLQHGGPV